MTRRIAALALLIGLASSGHEIVRADIKVYAGETCVNSSTTGIMRRDFGALGNDSDTDSLRVDCPIIHDAGDVLDGAVLARNSGTSPLTCSFVDVHTFPNDPNTYGVFEAHSINPGAARQWMTFGAFSNTSTSHRLYQCLIPPRSLGPQYLSEVSLYKLNEQ